MPIKNCACRYECNSFTLLFSDDNSYKTIKNYIV